MLSKLLTVKLDKESKDVRKNEETYDVMLVLAKCIMVFKIDNNLQKGNDWKYRLNWS